jgi:hypothetical protein
MLDKASVPPVIFVATGGISLIAALLLACLFFYYVPFGSDGGWYAYPGYAWAHGGDPSENIPGVARPSPPPDRPVVKFSWENRSNLTVLLTRAWFELAPSSWAGLKALGALQLVILTVLIGVAARQVTNSFPLALLAALMVASDSRVIAAACADARPDLFIVIVAVGLLILLIAALESVKRTPIVLAAAGAVVLPLLHVTAANAIAYVIAFLACYVVLGRDRAGSARRRSIALLIVLLLIAVFFLRQPILDHIIPTKVPEGLEIPYRHVIADELRGIIDHGLVAKLTMEATRWREYFFVANTGHFIFLVLGLVVAARLALRTLPPAKTRPPYDIKVIQALSLSAGFVVGFGTIFVFDSHTMTQHALVIAVLGYLGSVASLGAAEQASLISKTRLVQIGCLLLGVGAVLNIAHSFSLYRQYAAFGMSNPRAEAAILDALPKQGDIRIIGPTEIWPYLATRRQPLLLFDNERAVFRHHGWVFDSNLYPYFADSSYLIINKAYFGFDGWGLAVKQWTRDGLIVRVAEVGNCELAMECYQIYRKIPSSPSKAGEVPRAGIEPAT